MAKAPDNLADALCRTANQEPTVPYANPRLASQQYQTLGLVNEVENASPHRLVQILLEGALERIARAVGCMRRREVAGKGENLGRAIAIVDSLRACLNPDAGEVAENLAALYDHVAFGLVQANINCDCEELERIAGILATVKSAWDAIAPETDAERAAASERAVAGVV